MALRRMLAKSVAAISPRTSRAGAGARRQGDEQVEAGDGQRRVAPAAVGNHLRQAVFEGRRGEQAGLRVDHASGVQRGRVATQPRVKGMDAH
jgi:hypothetical protein